ncbi:hypothetical protein R5R35_005811 [Gryllus longicercus]|uniref:Uncharacterized protein n=1 Tax=Gryllus longicercus TaxID=2509291 RepID=A0AAN9W7H9_9ORTH
MCLFGKRRKEKKCEQRQEGRRRAAGGEGDEVPGQRSVSDYSKPSRYDGPPPVDDVHSASSRDSRGRGRESSWKQQRGRGAPRGASDQSYGSAGRSPTRATRPYAKGVSQDDDYQSPYSYSEYDEPRASEERKTARRSPKLRASQERWSEERPSDTSAGGRGRGSSNKTRCQDNCQGVPKSAEGRPRSSSRRRGAPPEEKPPVGACALSGCPSAKLKRARKRKRKPTYGQRAQGRRQPSYAQPLPLPAARRPPRSFLECSYLPRGARPTANCAGVLF